MAELQQDTRRQTGVRKSKKLSTRIDLTPMVDLGFLLITFFIFTTTMSESKAMQLNLPMNSNEPTLTPLSKTLNVILTGENKILFYNGLDIKDMAVTDFSAKGIRNVILQKQRAIAKQWGHDSAMVVLIKPTEKSSYGNVVDMLDEMAINDVKKYVLMDADASETAMVEKLSKSVKN